MADSSSTKNEKMNRIRLVLAEKEISQKTLASLIDRTPVTVSRFCSNQIQPSIKLLREIAQALNVNVQELLEPTKVRD